jgi:putative ABC transport system permease protein
MDWQARVRALLEAHGASPDEDVVLELAQHADAAYAAAQADGLSAADAERLVVDDVVRWSADDAVARRRPKRPPVVDPPSAGSSSFAGLGLDVRYSARMLRRQPGFALVAIVTMALGIAAATTLFGVTYDVLMKPLPWPHADRLVKLTESREGGTRTLGGGFFTNAGYNAWLGPSATLDGLAGYANEADILSVGASTPVRVKVVTATASLFEILETPPAIGSFYTAADEAMGSRHVTLLSYSAWQRFFGGAPDAIGRVVDLDGVPYTVVGVMPRDFAFPDRETLLWTPLHVPPVVGDTPESRDLAIFAGLGRLKPGVTPAEASQEGTARARHAPGLGMAGVAVFGSNGPATVTATPLIEALSASVRPALLLLLAAVALLFVTAVASVAGMQLARSATRRRELAIRTAIGAGAARLGRQLLVENLLVAGAGGLAGLAVALWLHRLLPALLPAGFPRLEDLAFDWRVVGCAGALSMVAGLAFGLLPAWLARRINVVEALVEDSLAPVGGGLRTPVARTRTFIMAGQVAIATVLLVGAALLSRSFLALLHADLGYQPRNLVAAQVRMPEPLFTKVDRTRALDRLIARLQQVPGVTHAAATSILPLSHSYSLTAFSMPSMRSNGPTVSVHAAERDVSPDYFAAIGMRLIEGRGFSATDTPTSLPVVVVNRAFARTYLDGREPIGLDLPTGFAQDKPNWQIVGVVDDVHQQGATDPPQPEIFACYCQFTNGMLMDVPSVVVRTANDPTAYVATIRTLIRDAAPSAAIDSVTTMDARLASSLAEPRLYALLVAGFGVFALLIAGVALFGVLSYGVAQRVREIGVRIALGAQPMSVVRLVVAQGVVVTAAGAATGLVAALVLARYLGSFLFGISTRDPASFAGVTLVLLAVGATACFFPARRAARVDPLKALHGR